jgi:hypothetical protein
MLKQLARFRVPLIFGAAAAVWFLLGVVPRMIDGEGILPASWAAIKEVRPFEWVVVFCVWLSVVFPHKPTQTKTTTLAVTGQK